MTTDITELAQLRGRTVDYPYYLVECDCGKIYPSSELSGGEPMGDSGDYSDCYCPHCGEGEEHFAECADPETAWKAQQDKIDALVEALEKAQQRIAELESRTVKLPNPHAHLIWIQAGHAPDDYWDDVAVSHSEKDRCCDGSERYPVYARWEIEEMLTAAGIKWEAE
ncbi:hypothetical protein PVM14_06320 [Klebsiella quasipneumoniae]|uniref:hypothetical protein n=1 Tax=Klebsiella pneumoniae complex TaxID=3390273 RepID=UPI002155B361|nr:MULTISPECIES: hypothetical protein [Klebsiella]MDD9214124.1 hypothetical protein [Klebsiella quasipneumoniae]